MAEQQVLAGIGFALLGGMLQGAMLWPMKLMDKWDWENTWLAFSAAAYLLAPWALALWSVPRLVEALGNASARALGLTFLFGLGWGLGTVLFGLGIAIVGLGIGYAIVMGLTISVGTFVPLLALAPQEVFARRGLMMLVGVATTITGTALCSYAGQLRAKKLGLAVPTRGAMLRRSFRLGLILCVSAGILIPGGNLALAFGSEVTAQARATGASPLRSVNALWAVAEVPLFLCGAAYCLYLLRHNHSFANFRKPKTGHYWLVILFMGAVQMAGIGLYGFGAASLGTLGTSIGFSILMSSMILTANVLGVASGEWKGAGGWPANVMVLGLVILTGALVLIGFGARPGA